ncbi:oxygen-independent coproporphyrinogen III oxidase [Rhodobacterales bacterium HKCCE2091]|nr:oxygen-independent coproporphyrinogen III oxidase [Rhodobacterales bacterium HKCCE2091]
MEQIARPLQPRRLDTRVPRYTSYPPANHFGSGVGAAEYGDWLAAVPADEAVSLYVHVPFCRRLCHFCACRTQGTRTAAPVDRYLDHLEREIALVADRLPGRMSVGHLHLGGGTPTILTPAQTERLRSMIDAAFDVAADAEIAVELDPTEIDEARLDALAAFGINRASIGIQDFDPGVQAAIGREQGVPETLRAAAGLRVRGVRSLNVDLLYGLPHQTRDSLRRTLDTVAILKPDRIAIYGYAHVPWVARRQRLIPADALPGLDDRIGLSDLARRLLTWQGYAPVGIDHFALPDDDLARAAEAGTLHRNFQGYTTDRADTLIGLGASALSRLRQGYAQNAPATSDWQNRVGAGTLGTVRGHEMSPEDRIRAEVIERLMCDFEIDLTEATRAAPDLLPGLSATAAMLAATMPDQVAFDDGVLFLTGRDGTYARIVAAEFDTYRSPERQYSSAI